MIEIMMQPTLHNLNLESFDMNSMVAIAIIWDYWEITHMSDIMGSNWTVPMQLHNSELSIALHVAAASCELL